MTKAELIAALAGVPDEAPVYVDALPQNPDSNLIEGDLSEIVRVQRHETDGPGTFPFAVIVHEVN